MNSDFDRADATFQADPTILPSNLYGRVTSVLIGGFFGFLGGASLALLISNRRGLDAYLIYEISIVALLFGTVYFLWGLFTPRWLIPVAQHVVRHVLWLILILFLPFAIHVLFLLVTGQI